MKNKIIQSAVWFRPAKIFSLLAVALGDFLAADVRRVEHSNLRSRARFFPERPRFDNKSLAESTVPPSK